MAGEGHLLHLQVATTKLFSEILIRASLRGGKVARPPDFQLVFSRVGVPERVAHHQQTMAIVFGVEFTEKFAKGFEILEKTTERKTFHNKD